MQNTQEKIVTYEEIQANPMLRWFFDERDHSENDEYYSQWIEYIKAIDLDSTLYIYTKTKAHINFGEKFDRKAFQPLTMPQYLALQFSLFSREFFTQILAYISDQRQLNALLYYLAAYSPWISQKDCIEKHYLRALDLLKLFISKGANINAVFYSNPNNAKMGTFQSLAAKFLYWGYYVEFCETLLELGADPNITNVWGENFLEESYEYASNLTMAAIGRELKSMGIIRTLLERGKMKMIDGEIRVGITKFDYFDKGATTGLHIAINLISIRKFDGEERLEITRAFAQCVKALIEQGHHINAIARMDNALVGFELETPLDRLMLNINKNEEDIKNKSSVILGLAKWERQSRQEHLEFSLFLREVLGELEQYMRSKGAKSVLEILDTDQKRKAYQEGFLTREQEIKECQRRFRAYAREFHKAYKEAPLSLRGALERVEVKKIN